MSTNTKEMIKVEGMGNSFEVSKIIFDTVNKAIAKHSIKNDIIEKSEDISKNIRDGYYYAKMFKNIYCGSSDETYVKIFDSVEAVINATSTPREYESDLKNAKQCIKHFISIQNYKVQNEDRWDSDFRIQNDITEELMSKISSFIYENCSADEYNKPSIAEDLLEFYKLDR